MSPKFYIGQIIYHQRFNYRGVIIGIDAVFSHSEFWYENMTNSRPPKDEPWYNVLVDQSFQTTYVAERNLFVNKDYRQIDHPLLGDYFVQFDGRRYYSIHKFH